MFCLHESSTHPLPGSLQSGFIFALAYFLQFLITVVFGYVVDRIRARNIISLTALRKIQSIIGMSATCCFLVAIGYMGCNYVSAVVFCILAIGFLGFQSCGPLISHLDVASNYAGKSISRVNRPTLSVFDSRHTSRYIQFFGNYPWFCWTVRGWSNHKQQCKSILKMSSCSIEEILCFR